MRLALLAFLALALCGSAVQADTIATFQFNFASPNGINPSTAVSNPVFNPSVSMSLTPSANVVAPGINSLVPTVTQSAAGLGVGWSGTQPLTLPFIGTIQIPVSDTNPGEVDQFGGFETLNLTFNPFDPRIEDAVITSIIFSNITNSDIPIIGELVDDDIRVLLNGVQIGLIDPTGNGPFAVNIPIVAGDMLSFQAPFELDNFSVLGLTVQANVVPEPASIAVWSVLGGIGLAAWRKRKAKSVA